MTLDEKKKNGGGRDIIGVFLKLHLLSKNTKKIQGKLPKGHWDSQ